MYSPLSGKVLEVNNVLTDKPATVSLVFGPEFRASFSPHHHFILWLEHSSSVLSQVNSDPYKAGWIMKVKISDKSEVSKLLDAAAYKAETEH